jgi:RNA polymerase sigma factor (TIGR02999 family)
MAPTDVTGLLRRLRAGDDPDALDHLMPLVYEELRRLAHAQLRRERQDHTLRTTELVHEAYLRLVDVRRVQWQDRAHFLAMAARLMRRVLIDYARAAGRLKRGGDRVVVPLEDGMPAPAAIDLVDLIALDVALERLEEVGERPCRVVEYRCFAGLSVEETAEVLGTSVATVKRDWAFARAWLNRELEAGADA